METGHRIAVLGLGRSGIAVVRWALARRFSGEDVEVTAFVEHDTPALRSVADELRALGASVELGVTAVPEQAFDLVVASPGIAPHRPLALSARSLGVPVISELELAYRVSAAPIVAVTGTNGKTTTTALIAHVLREAGVTVQAVGNIGEPAISAAAAVDSSSVLVAECSSFQLALTVDFRPRVALLLNIAPDHIDWHGSMEAYAKDKTRVFARQGDGDTAVIDVDDPGSAPWADVLECRGVPVVRVSRERMHPRGASVVGGVLTVDTDAGPVSLVRPVELGIRGAHNVSNALAGAAAALLMGADAAGVRAGLRSFRPIEHRLEPVAVVGGVEYVNDSKATNPDATLKALSAFDGRPVIVMLGGRNKGNAFDDIARACVDHCRMAVLFGEARSEIEGAFRRVGAPYVVAESMGAALEEAAHLARRGDVVVLSPACASFDEFEDYEDRGRTFSLLVAGMAGDPP